MTAVWVKKATLADLDSVLVLWEAFMVEDEQTLPSFFGLAKSCKKPLRKYALKCLNDSSNAFFIAKMGSVSVGFVQIQLEDWPAIFKTQKSAELKNFFVFKPFRGKRVSSAIMKTVKAFLSKKKIKFLTLDVAVQNKSARDVYAHWGFEPFEEKCFLGLSDHSPQKRFSS